MAQQVGPYEVLGELGRGAFGAVLRARDPATGEELALKLLLRGRDAPATARERFAREARALERLRHPGIVSVRATGEDQGTPWLAMDLVDGESLEQRLSRGGPLPEAEAARVALGVARALAHAHANEVLHRDVKPSNVLLDAAGAPRLSDFGLAKELDATGASLTRSGVVLGTPGYCAPEQVGVQPGQRPSVGGPADVYGLGATLYAALAGTPPIEGESVVEVLLATAHRPPTPPSAHRPGLDARLEALVLRCLAKEPGRRPTAADVAAELERWLGDASPRQRRRARSRRLRRVAGAAGALAVVGAAGLALRPGAPPAAPTAPTTPTTPPSSAPATTATRPATRPARTGPVPAEAKAAAELLVEEGLEAEARGDLQAAERCYEDALERWPGSAHAAFGLGNMLERRGALPEALAVFDRALALEPGRAILWAGRGLARSKVGDKTGSLADLEQAHTLDPDHLGILVNLGGARAAVGDGVGAMFALDDAIRRDRDCSAAWLNRAHAKRMLGDARGALSDAEEAGRLTPDDPNTQVMRGVLRFDLGDVAGAEECHSRAIEAGGGAEARACRAVCRFEREDQDGAARDARGALTLEADCALAQAALGLVLARRGDAQGALEQAAAALAREPDLPLAHVARGDALRLVRDHPAARAAYDRALELDARSALAHLGRGLLSQAEGDVQGADRDLTKALELHPRLARAWLERGLLRLTRGGEAEPDLARARELLPPGHPDALRAERVSAGR